MLKKSFSRVFKYRYSTSPVESNLVEVFVDDVSIKIPAGSAIIQACEKANVSIPRFCYHQKLAVAGNCRMCLVQVEKAPKPIASCAFPVAPGMRIFTSTPMVKKAREGVMEMLLANHPLDCPICDQGGECDLQDQAMAYGSDRGRYIFPKRAVEDKDFGPLISTTMTRCIHCTRCVRFANEIAGASELGTSGRGNDMQIGMYIDKPLKSEMSGNVIDLCPVGALTSKPYAFKARPWELKKTESIDVMDAIGSNIVVGSRGVEVMRILPRLNDQINEEWINDKTRFAFDGLARQRLLSPMVKGPDNTFKEVSWKEALEAIAEGLDGISGGQLSVVAGKFTDAETLVAAKDLFNQYGTFNYRLDVPGLCNGTRNNPDFRSNYILNSQIQNIESSDAALLIGTNPRHEGSILNVRLRHAYLNNNLSVGVFGEKSDLSYKYEHLGDDLKSLERVTKHPFFKKLMSAQRPVIIVGSGVIDHEACGGVYEIIAKLVQKVPNLVKQDWNGFNVLQRDASMVAALDVGFFPSVKSTPVSESKFVYLLGADENINEIPNDAFVVYQGHHGDAGAHRANVILPGTAYTEKSATFVNTEGRAQITRTAVSPPGLAREDWKIIRALSEVVGKTLAYDDVIELRERMYDISPTLIGLGVVERSSFTSLGLSSVPSSSSVEPFRNIISDFYLTDIISRHSSTMAQCSEAFLKEEKEAH
jgi:NADH dehydrogenase (ubiquinone) Fe-S protein 1